MVFFKLGVVPLGEDTTLGKLYSQGDIQSYNWNGGTDLSSRDTTATVGFFFDASEGAQQIMGDYFLGGNMEIRGDVTLETSGILRTAASGQRIEFTNTTKNYISFYSGDADEVDPSQYYEGTSGSGADRTLQTTMLSPSFHVDRYRAALVVRSGSYDNSTYAPAVIVTRGSGDTTGLTPEFRLESGAIMRAGAGSASIPAIYFADPDTGFYAATNGQVSMAINGVAHDVGTDFNSFTPVLRAITTNPTLGTGGSASGRWIQTGKIVHAWVKFTFGTSGYNEGSGHYQWDPSADGLPAMSTGHPTLTPMGTLYVAGSSTGVRYVGYPMRYSGSIFNFKVDDTGGYVGTTDNIPFSPFDANDEIRFFVTYVSAT